MSSWRIHTLGSALSTITVQLRAALAGIAFIGMFSNPIGDGYAQIIAAACCQAPQGEEKVPCHVRTKYFTCIVAGIQSVAAA